MQIYFHPKLDLKFSKREKKKKNSREIAEQKPVDSKHVLAKIDLNKRSANKWRPLVVSTEKRPNVDYRKH